MFTVYAIRSEKFDYTYIGFTNNLERRLSQHFSGKSSTARAYRPFVLIYKEKLKTRLEARNREKFLKSSSVRSWLKNHARVAELVDAYV